MRVHWFYDVWETELPVVRNDTATLGGLPFDARQLWRAKDRDNDRYIADYALSFIDRWVVGWCVGVGVGVLGVGGVGGSGRSVIGHLIRALDHLVWALD